jgi:hypothetical protein
VKKKVAATRIIAAAETTISVVEFDLVGCFGRDDDDEDVTLAAGAEGSATGTVAACGGGSCSSGGEVGILSGVTMLAGTLLGGTIAVGTFAGGTWLGRIWLLSARAASGALGRGTWKMTVAPLLCGEAVELS